MEGGIARRLKIIKPIFLFTSDAAKLAGHLIRETVSHRNNIEGPDLSRILKFTG